MKARGRVLKLASAPNTVNEWMGGWVAMLSKKEFQYWDKFVCVCVLCNQCTLALTSRVHTSANAVLMKPFITSSLLNLHEPLSLSRSLALSLTRSLAHSLVFSSVRMCVRTRCSTSWLLCVWMHHFYFGCSQHESGSGGDFSHFSQRVCCRIHAGLEGLVLKCWALVLL